MAPRNRCAIAQILSPASRLFPRGQRRPALISATRRHTTVTAPWALRARDGNAAQRRTQSRTAGRAHPWPAGHCGRPGARGCPAELRKGAAGRHWTPKHRLRLWNSSMRRRCVTLIFRKINLICSYHTRFILYLQTHKMLQTSPSNSHVGSSAAIILYLRTRKMLQTAPSNSHVGRVWP
jgi:hypothetical protein